MELDRRRRLGRLGLCILVAGAVLATFAGTASATRLCSAEGVKEKCTAGFYVPPTTLEAQLTTGVNWVLDEGFAKLECGTSTLKGQLTSGGGVLGVSVKFNLETLTWGACTCPKMELGAALPWPMVINGTGNKDGEVVGTYNLKSECAKEVCIYKANLVGVIEGGTPAKYLLSNNLIPQGGSGGKCGNPTVLSASYTFKAPAALYVTKE